MINLIKYVVESVRDRVAEFQDMWDEKKQEKRHTEPTKLVTPIVSNQEPEVGFEVEEPLISKADIEWGGRLFTGVELVQTPPPKQ